MKRTPKFWRRAAWSATVVSAVLLIAWVGSNWILLAWLVFGRTMVVVASGSVFLDSIGFWDEVVFSGFSRNRPELYGGLGHDRWGFHTYATNHGILIQIPLWFLLAMSMVWTVIAWFRYRRALRPAPAEACPNCGYNRAGLATKVPCPECNTAAAAG